VPRAATTADVFNAIAEARRRDILVFLADGERAVGDIVDRFALSQPSVSKHLRVLSDVGLVEARREGQRIFYRTNADGLRPVHDWTATFEHYWSRQLQRIRERAERKGPP
jgi:DNA-binding transcriptional ArsR family regulator